MNPNLNHGLRNFFGYLKDSFKANEVANQTKVRILFSIVLLFYGAAYLYATQIMENLNAGILYENFLKDTATLFSNPKLFDASMQNQLYATFQTTFAPYISVFVDLFFVSVLTYLPYFFVSMITILYCKDLMAHHLPLNAKGITKESPVLWRAFLLQLCIMPFAFLTIAGTDIFSIILYPFLNSIYWFFVFSLFDRASISGKFGAAFVSAFAIYRKRFIQLIFIVVFFQILSSLIISIMNAVFETFNRPFLTASVQAFLFAIMQFISIRFLFFIYKDIKHPELIKNPEKEEENYDD